jgi:predicted ATPase
VGPRGESSIAALLAADQAGQKVSARQQGRARKDSSILQVVAEWLRELGIIHSFEVRPLAKGKRYYEVRVRRTAASPEVLLPDVGFGVSQVLPILVQSFYAAPHSTMLYEQPELHLHPSAQSELADAIIDASIRGNVQFLIESHSEHFLRRIQRRVAEGLPQEHVALYKCEVIDGVSTLQRLIVDAKGNVTNWPRDFFGDTIGDLMAMTKAAAAPRRSE